MSDEDARALPGASSTQTSTLERGSVDDARSRKAQVMRTTVTLIKNRPMAIPCNCSLRATVTLYGHGIIDNLPQNKLLRHQVSVPSSSRQERSQIGEDLARRLQISDNASNERFWFRVNSSLGFEFYRLLRSSLPRGVKASWKS